MAPLTNPRHERFAQGLAEGKNASEAYVAAGYRPNTGNASTLKADQNVSKRVTELVERRSAVVERATEKAVVNAVEKLALTKEWVITRLMENAERALRRVPVFDDDGKPTGEWTYQGMVANRALELLGKHLGILVERREIGEPGEFDRLAAGELYDELAREASELGVPVHEGNGTSH